MRTSFFEIDDINTFVSIVECGSFTRAAKRMGRSQPAVSQQIKKLEHNLGKRVFHRDVKELKITIHGEILLKYARQILQLSNNAYHRVVGAELYGMVRLGINEDLSTNYLSDMLAEFARMHPFICLEIHCDITKNLMADFAKGMFDFIIFKRDPQDRLDGAEIWREALDWVASPQMIVLQEKPVPLVLPPMPHSDCKQAIAALETHQRSWRIIYTSQSLSGLKAAAKAGLGVAVLPVSMISDGLISVSMAFSLPKLADMEIAIHQTSNALSPAAELLSLSIKNFFRTI